ncbi:MAG: helix-turn-helix domain-containing protein [Clostridiales bacterium]|nr:helix-turn-helix domain-containing protein [Clostridiales bacterium]
MDILEHIDGSLGSPVDILDDDVLIHYGTKRHSGRYPWGSGETPYQHSGDFLSRVEELKKQGLTEKQMSEELGMEIKEFRVFRSIAGNERKAELITHCKNLHEKGYSNIEIAKKLGIPDTTVGNYIRKNEEAKLIQSQETANVIKKLVDEKGLIDVGKSAELSLGCSRNMLDDALIVCEADGYFVSNRRVNQPTNPGKSTTIRVVGPPGTVQSDLYNEEIHTVEDYHSHDGGATYVKTQPPSSLDSKRIYVRYAEDGGKAKDGVIEIRPGVEDLSLGNSHYAQIRTLVDGKAYIKGMALYSDEIPEGYDILINSNKKRGTPLLPDENGKGVLKPAEKDPKNPFGALIKTGEREEYVDPETGKVVRVNAGGQYEYMDSKTGKMKLSPINKTREEGDWNEWSDTLPSQFLAKQKIEFINTQLNLSIADRKAELDEIMALENPALRKKYLMDFAGDCDTNASTLSAAALPRQKYQVILPLNDIKDTEVYAPNFKDGEKVALVRFPHENTGQIPILTVNNKNAEGKKVLGANALDAVGINAHVAERLSGADFDGDTVLVLPTGKNRMTAVTNREPLPGLKDFDTKMAYPGIPDPKSPTGYANKIMKKGADQQKQMGMVSNLIMDMTLKGASDEELACATKHSMVVIDSAKHHLDYEASKRDNNINALTKRWKGHVDPETGRYSEGASTLLTLAGSEARIPLRKGSGVIDKETGEITYRTAPDNERFYTDKKGKTVERFSKVDRMSITKNPYSLSSGTAQEEAYAGYASELKSMANYARKTAVNTPTMKFDKSAAEKYAPEVKSLNDKLLEVNKNKPRERQAQLRADSRIKERMQYYKDDHPDYGKAELNKHRKKVAQQEMAKAREEVGAKSIKINITPKEWEAIQSGAIHEAKQKDIFLKCDQDQLRSYAMPKNRPALTQAKINKIEAMKNSGYSNTEIADAIGVSRTTVINYMNPNKKD